MKTIGYRIIRDIRDLANAAVSDRLGIEIIPIVRSIIPFSNHPVGGEISKKVWSNIGFAGAYYNIVDVRHNIIDIIKDEVF